MKKSFKFIIILFFSIVFFLAISLAIFGSRGFFAPPWLVSKFETKIGNNLGGTTLSIGDVKVEFFKDNSFIYTTLFKVVLKDSGSNQLAYLNEIEATFGYENIVQFNLKPQSLLISNSTLVVTKNLDGDFSFEMRESQEVLEGSTYTEIVEVLGLMEEILDQEVFENLSFFSAINTNIAFSDRKSGKTWWFNRGQFTLTNLEEQFSAQFSANLLYGNDTTAEGLLKLVKRRGEEAKISVTIENILVKDLSDQFPEFNFLSKFDLPVSISISATLLDNGSFEGVQGVLESGKGEVLLSNVGQKIYLNNAKFYFEYDQNPSIFNIKQVSVDTEYGKSIGFGKMFIGESNNRDDLVITGQFQFDDTTIFVPNLSTKNLYFDKIITDFNFDFNTQILKIGQLFAKYEDINILSSGSFSFTDNGIEGRSKFQLSDIGIKTFAEFWPFIKGSRTKVWALENIIDGNLKNVNGIVSVDTIAGNDFHVTFLFDDINLQLPENFSPLINATGNGELSGDYFHTNFETGYLYTKPNSLMDVSGSKMRILMGENENSLMNIHLTSVASLPATLKILNDLPEDYKIPEKLFSYNMQGISIAETVIVFQLGKKRSQTNVIFSTNGEIRSVSIDNVYDNAKIESEKLIFTADNEEFEISGDLNFNGNLITGSWKKLFEKNTNNISHLEGKLKVDQSLFKTLGLDTSEIAISGDTIANFSIMFSENSSPKFKLKSDLRGLGLQVKSIDWVKEPNESAQFNLEGNLGLVPEVSGLNFSSRDLFVNGKLFFDKNGDLDRLICSSLIYGDWLDTIIEVRKTSGGDFAIDILGGDVDLRKIAYTLDEKYNLDYFPSVIELDNITISDDINLNNFEAQFLIDEFYSGIFEAQINNGPLIDGSITRSKNGPAFKINSADAGAVLKSLGVFENARNGDLNVILIPGGEKGVYNGELIVKNTRVVNAPALAELLSAVSVIGLLEQMDGQGLAFSEGKANFSLSEERIQIKDSSAIGASMGLTMQGYLNSKTGEINASGVITPFYAVNGIFEQTGLFAGLLGKKKGEGVFGFNYHLKGVEDNLMVEVNPLSILTPGVFRELFNSPMPEKTE